MFYFNLMKSQTEQTEKKNNQPVIVPFLIYQQKKNIQNKSNPIYCQLKTKNL